MKLRIEKLESTSKLDYSRILLLLPSKDEATAEDLSMLQALYSRDPRPIDDALRLAKTSKSGEFMNKFYVGYGHSSIAECGSFTLAIENVPMIIAKLIQHNQLYRGQECSTRYLDFSKQQFISNSGLGSYYQEELRSFYIKWLPIITESIIKNYKLDKSIPFDLKTAQASAFDVMRGFLPIGACTNLSWTTDLKTFNDHVARLRTIQDNYYGLKEVLDKMVKLVSTEFPNSIFESRDDGALKFTKYSIKDKIIKVHDLMNDDSLIECHSKIDFASWRDFARHRSIFQEFPIIDVIDFSKFYMTNLPDEAKDEFISIHRGMILDNLDEGRLSIYDFPMGCNVYYYFSGYLSKLEYILKLRSSRTVHPTLRREILYMADRLDLMNIIKKENRTTDWVINSKRGNQTISIK